MYTGISTDAGQLPVHGRSAIVADPKMEWKRFSPVRALQLAPPLRMQSK